MNDKIILWIVAMVGLVAILTTVDFSAFPIRDSYGAAIAPLGSGEVQPVGPGYSKPSI